MEKLDTKRQVAYKVPIIFLNKGQYVKQEGWEPNYILLPTSEKVSRVNIIAAITSLASEKNPFYSMIIDDGTGSIEIRSFEDNKTFNDLKIGQILNIIGKPRIFGNDKFIMPEIIRPITDERWIKARALEIKKDSLLHKPDVSIIKEPNSVQKKVEEELIVKNTNSDFEQAIELIRKNDTGPGAETQHIISLLKNQDGEKIVNKLLELGEIFETQPGKIKVLD